MKLLNNKTTTLLLSSLAILALSGCGTEGAPSERGLSGTPVVTPPVDGNTPPVANAGTDQTIKQCTKITLDGTKSYDEDGNIASYEWFAQDGQKVGEGATFEYTMTLPVPVETYTVTLLVTDNEGAQAQDAMNITFEDYNLTVTNKGVIYNDFDGSAIKDMEFSTDGKKLYTAAARSASNGGDDIPNGLTILDLETNITTHIEVGDSHSRYVKLSKDEQTAYLTGGDDYYFAFIDLTNNTVRKIVDLDDYAVGIAVTADGTKAYVGWETQGVAVMDLQTEQNTSRLILNDNDNYANTVILSQDEKTLFVTESGDGFVSYDLVNNTFETIATDGGSEYAADFALSSDEKTAYVTLGGDGGMDIIDIEGKNIITRVLDINGTDQLSKTRQVKATWDDKLLFVADMDYDNTLFVVDLNDNNKITQVKNTSGITCKKPDAVEISPDGSKVFLGCGNGVVAEFDIGCQ